MKIYTKTGDGGETGLVGGSRVPKDDPRVAAYGDVDELNAVLGVARAHADDRAVARSSAASSATCSRSARSSPTPARRWRRGSAKAAVAAARRSRELEKAIDAREARAAAAARLHPARAARRWAPRCTWRARCAGAPSARSWRSAAREPVDAVILVYLNRLSDLLFVLARHANHAAGQPGRAVVTRAVRPAASAR